VASACAIDFLAPAREGDLLEAEAVERSRSGRTGVYDVTVRVVGGKTVALFRGKSYRIDGEVIAGLSTGLTHSTPPRTATPAHPHNETRRRQRP
jgi:acyl-CoA thioesterase